MIHVTFGGKEYRYDIKTQMESLTGTESILVEDYLGGWSRFRDPGNFTRSAVVMVWLAKRSAGEKATFEEIADTPGMPFGDAFQTADDDADLDGQSPPELTQTTTTVPKPVEQDVSPRPVLTRLSERETA